MEGGVIIDVGDNESCVREVRLYDREEFKLEFKVQESPNCGTLGTRGGLVSAGKYKVEAEDYAGNKSSTPFDYHFP